ncbi:MAG TPA: histidine kinase dimerization/phosphoacceptor domain -containing protein [Allosphingosinicella sp.]|nr:histidine kinase dimerization/phosphoacceptor domain -containing protein [Allosphingosinicella sp.]
MQFWLASRWARLSTGVKMFFILSLGLLPLGIIAVTASIDNARANRTKADVEAAAQLDRHAQRFQLALSRNSFTVRAARDAIIETRDPTGICRRTLDRLGRFPNTPGRFALYGEGPTPRCLSRGFAPPAAPPARAEIGRPVILRGGNVLRIFMFDPRGALEGIAEYRREALARAVNAPPVAGNFVLELVQGDRVMTLRTAPPGGALSREVVAGFPFGNGELSMRLRASVPPVNATDLLVILTPVLMWLWASLVGWIIVQRLLLRPLGRIQNVISAYKPGDRGLDLPTVRSPAQEIGAVGEAFAQVTRTVARHEAELEAAVVRQTRLVREVHHRVKNNLQVVASLLNLHARGSATEEVAAAYASIQRRVDALAVVHRNHYAELEANRGVALKPLLSELGASLRASAPASAASMQIRLDVAPLYATQDAAVSVAFLVTEIVEFGMLCGAELVSVVLEATAPDTARLSVAVDALAGSVDCDPALADRFDRIVTGLARQLRSALDRDPARGRYSVALGILEGEIGE